MNNISKYEATGIFLSIAVMAVVLAFIRFQPSLSPGETASEANQQQGTVVVADNDPLTTGGLEQALRESATLDGELENLIIEDVKVGTGQAAAVGDTLTVDYIGATRDGIEFDSSYARGEPFIFTIGAGRVIEGWDKGLVGMKVGGQRILIIPSDMAYGNLQVGPIEAGSTLVFAIELLGIK